MIFKNPPFIHLFKSQSSKDNFHKLILGIDKIIGFCIIKPTAIIQLSLSMKRGWWMEKDL